MFKNTKRVDSGGWRFDWVTDLGDVFGGLRFYPKTGILSSWSRRPHKAAKENYHPYRINDYTWSHIRQACIKRWGDEELVTLIANVKPLVKMAYYSPAFGSKWVEYDKYKDLIEKNLVHWKADGLLITER